MLRVAAVMPGRVVFSLRCETTVGVGPSGLRSGPSSAFRTSSRAEAAFLLDKAGDLVDALADAQIAEDEGTRAAHAPGIALHDGKRGADVRREVDLVDHEQIGAGDAGTALGRNLVARRDVDHIERQVGKLGRE